MINGDTASTNTTDVKMDKIVLKMTIYSDEDILTSFVVDKEGGGIGRSSSNVVSVPADKYLAEINHAIVHHENGKFYIWNGEQSNSSTYIRLR